MKKLKILFAAAVAIAFCSCSNVDHGVVIQKWHEEGRYYTYYTIHRIGKSTITVPHQGYDDPDWKVRVSDREGDEVYEETDEISESVWNLVQVGDSFFRDSTGSIYFKHNVQ